MFIFTFWRDIFIVCLVGWSYGLIAACVAILGLGLARWIEIEILRWLMRSSKW